MWTPLQARDSQQQAIDMTERETARQIGYIKELSKRLKEIDPYLELAFAPEGARHVMLTPGRWHLIRHNPGAPPTITALTGEDGEYEEPSSKIIDRLQALDLQSPAVMRDRQRKDLEELKQVQQRRDAFAQEIREEAAMRLKAKVSPSIRFGGSWKAKLK